MDYYDEVKDLLERIKHKSYSDPSKATDAMAMGMLMSHYFGYNGVPIFEAAAEALEDSNFHTEAAELRAYVERGL